MKQVYEDYLFSQGYFVSTQASESEGMETREDETPAISSHPAEALIALAHFAEIRITEHPELANLHMLEVAARNLGKDVPEPFMRGFPESALKLTSEQLLIDQLINYFITYDLGDMSQRRHSLLEEFYGRSAFAENVEPKLFAIVTPEKAEQLLAERCNAATLKSDRLMARLLKTEGKDAVLQLKRDNYNLKLEEFVVGADQGRMLDVVDDIIVPRAGLVFLTPQSHIGRAPFYSSEKILGSWHVKTLWFNIAVLLLMCIIVITLLISKLLAK